MTRGMTMTSHTHYNLPLPLDHPVIRTSEGLKNTESDRFQRNEACRARFIPTIPKTSAMPSAFRSEIPAREKISCVHTSFQSELNASPSFHVNGFQDAYDELPAGAMWRQEWALSSQNI